MLIVCDNCGAEYEVDADARPRTAPGRGLRFRCSACGHTFSISDAGEHAESLASQSAVSQNVPVEPPMLLKQEGKVYQVESVATLQRWIVERRVLREDMISIGGLKWEPVGSRRDLQVFFQLVDVAETGDASGAAAGGPPLADSADRQEVAPSDDGLPWVAAAELPSTDAAAVAAPSAGFRSAAGRDLSADPMMSMDADPDPYEADDDEGTDAGLPIMGEPPAPGGSSRAELYAPPEAAVLMAKPLRNLAAADAPLSSAAPLAPQQSMPAGSAAQPASVSPQAQPLSALHARIDPARVSSPGGRAALGADVDSQGLCDDTEEAVAGRQASSSAAHRAPVSPVQVAPAAAAVAHSPRSAQPAPGLSDDMLFPDETEERSHGTAALRPPDRSEARPSDVGSADSTAAWADEPRRRSKLSWLLGAAVVALVLALGWWWAQQAGAFGAGQRGGRDGSASQSTSALSYSGTASEAVDVGSPSAQASKNPRKRKKTTRRSATGSDSAGKTAAPADPAASEAAASEAAASDAAASEAAASEAAASDAVDSPAAGGGTAQTPSASPGASTGSTSGAAAQVVSISAAPDALVPVAIAPTGAASSSSNTASSAPRPSSAARTTTTTTRTAPARSTASVSRLVDSGWKNISAGRFSDARQSFASAVDAQPGSSEARFGLGYSYEKLGNQPAAVRFYCSVIAQGSGDSRMEAEGRLRALGITCE